MTLEGIEGADPEPVPTAQRCHCPELVGVRDSLGLRAAAKTTLP